MTNGMDNVSDEPENREIPPPASLTRELFLKWRSPQPGHFNPEPMSNPVWDWLIRSRKNAYHANQHFNGPDPMDAGPCWCFDRFGQSSTEPPDGRVVLIAGEHEDHYDPDFYIYNDVVVKHPDGRVEIFGYPREVFPPTDFHSATLVGNHIIIIGNLGYPASRQPGATQVLTLYLTTFAIASVNTSGTPPGWIHGHSAILSEDGNSILVSGGKLDRGGDDRSLVENIDAWRLHLADWRWERLTEHRWLRWDVLRGDGKRNHLWEIQQAVWSRSLGWDKELGEQMGALENELGVRPELDQMANLFRPAIPHEEVAGKEDEYNVFRIVVNGVIIRYVVDMHSIQITIEGDLDQASVDAITSDFVRKMSALENANFVLKQL